MRMEFLTTNYLKTTTMVAVNNGTTSVDNLFDRDSGSEFQSSGDNSDATTTTVRVDFSSVKSLSYIALQNINLKGFKIYYNSNSANLFSMTAGDTLTSEWTGNSATNVYLYFSTVTAINSVFIEATTTIIANEEKKVGEFWIGERRLQFERNPDVKGYKTKQDPKQWVHKMAGGGWSVYTLSDYFTAEIKLKYISTSHRDSLRDLQNDYQSFVFAPFPTGSDWNGEIYEVNWIKDWSGNQPSINEWDSGGWDIRMSLRETPR